MQPASLQTPLVLAHRMGTRKTYKQAGMRRQAGRQEAMRVPSKAGRNEQCDECIDTGVQTCRHKG